jgi:hypothetical protein
LDVALRERAVNAETDYEYDDHAAGASAGAADGADQPAQDDAEDYVLYSEVKPHLEALVQLQAERARMVELLLYARDRVASPAVATRMDDNLAQLGIRLIVPQVGDRFDPQQHEASATVQTDNAALHGTIAEVELAGYLDGEQTVRHPIVTVYTTDRPKTA